MMDTQEVSNNKYNLFMVYGFARLPIGTTKTNDELAAGLKNCCSEPANLHGVTLIELQERSSNIKQSYENFYQKRKNELPEAMPWFYFWQTKTYQVPFLKIEIKDTDNKLLRSFDNFSNFEKFLKDPQAELQNRDRKVASL